MKAFLVLLCALCVLVVSAAPKPNKLYLTWTIAPDYDSNVTFIVYSQTNIVLPVGTWLPLTNISFDAFTASNKVAIPSASKEPTWFVVTASNVFGESDFSDAIVSRLPSVATNFSVGRF